MNIAMQTVRLGLMMGLLAAVRPVSAQTWTPARVPGEDWKAVAMSADGSRLIAGAAGSNYCLSTDAGSTWTTNTEPQTGSENGSWVSIASSADGTVHAGVNFNAIWVSTNSGNSWLSNSVPGATFLGSVALSADGNKLVAAVGLPDNYSVSGLIYISTNWGVTMTPTMAPTNNWTSVASSADGNRLVAVTAFPNGGGLIFASTNAGLTWAGLPGAPTNNNWSAVAMSADGSKLVAASAVAFVPGEIFGGIYTSTDFGMTWRSNSVPGAQWQSVASSADGSRLIAAAVDPPGMIYTSTNSGATWISNTVPNYYWMAVALSADGNEMLAAPDGSAAPLYLSQSTPSPRLEITAGSNRFVLSWTIPSTHFVLQESADLFSWTAVTNTPVPNFTNLQDQVTLPASSNGSFFRLVTP